MRITHNTNILIVGLGLVGESYAEALTAKSFTVVALSDKKQ